jgi:hypothetical protein
MEKTFSRRAPESEIYYGLSRVSVRAMEREGQYVPDGIASGSRRVVLETVSSPPDRSQARPTTEIIMPV